MWVSIVFSNNIILDIRDSMTVEKHWTVRITVSNHSFTTNLCCNITPSSLSRPQFFKTKGIIHKVSYRTNNIDNTKQNLYVD